MYLNTSLVPAGSAAGARYRTVDVAAQVEAASPHRLVGILFDELVKTIDVLRAAQRRGDRTRRADRLSRTLSILSALETSLDFDKGGEIAVSLYQVYRETRRLVMEGTRENSSEPLDAAAAIVGEIASAWHTIG